MLNLKMPDINNVLIAGNLTSDPTLRKTSNGTPVANFYIASNRKFKDNTGQWRENVCFVGVVAWYKLADSCFEYLRKGSAILVEGELQSRSWKNDEGMSNNVVEIKARRIQFLNRQTKKEQSLLVDEVDELVPIEDINLESIEVVKNPTENQNLSNSTKYNFDYQDLNYERLKE